VSANHVVVAAVALVAGAAVLDAVLNGTPAEPKVDRSGYLIDLASSREGTYLAADLLRAQFPGRRPRSLAVSKVAEAPDDTIAVGVSHVPGNVPAKAAVELWRGEEPVRSFSVPAGSFARGLWFAGDGEVIATIGWNGRGYIYDRTGRPLRGSAYFAYETG